MVLAIYRITEKFPVSEQFGLTGQLRRCAVSVTSNIAEGFGRSSDKDRLHFYIMARGSASEMENQLLIARDIGFLSDNDYRELESQRTPAHKLINGLIRAQKSR